MVVCIVDSLPVLREDKAFGASWTPSAVYVAFLVEPSLEPRKPLLVVAEAVAANGLPRRIRLKRTASPSEAEARERPDMRVDTSRFE